MWTFLQERVGAGEPHESAPEAETWELTSSFIDGEPKASKQAIKKKNLKELQNKFVSSIPNQLMPNFYLSM